MTEQLEGQETLPADFPAPIMTADILIQRSIEEGISQMEYSTRTLMNDSDDEDESAKERRLLKSNMHYFSYLLDSVIADMLMQIQGVNRTWADNAAAGLDNKLDSGDYYPEMLWEWATDRGLDPEAITEKARAIIAEKETP